MKAKTWVVTGCSSGIGLGFVKELLAREQKVFAVTRNGSPELKQSEQNKNLTVIKCDLSKEGQEKVVAEALENRPVDVLINNAGILLGEGRGFESFSLRDLRKSLDVNLEAPIRLTKELLPLLRKSEDPKVVSITSQMGSIDDNGSGGYYPYRISKVALNMFNKSFAIDYPEIKSVVLHPGWVKTDMGGPQARLTIEESVNGLLKVIESLTSEQSGRFFNYAGQPLPW